MPLSAVSSDYIYIIGGLVDETGAGSLSRNKAGGFSFIILSNINVLTRIMMWLVLDEKSLLKSLPENFKITVIKILLKIYA